MTPYPQPPPSTFPWKPVLIVLGVGAFISCGLGVGCLTYFAKQPAGGVRLGNELTAQELDTVKKKFNLDEGESVRCYYDSSLSMDGEDVSLLTSRRVLFSLGKRITQLETADIEKIDHRDDGLVGDVIDVHSKSGESMRITIAPLNDGKVFLEQLRRAAKEHTLKE